jgi:hypothetical protein
MQKLKGVRQNSVRISQEISRRHLQWVGGRWKSIEELNENEWNKNFSDPRRSYYFLIVIKV